MSKKYLYIIGLLFFCVTGISCHLNTHLSTEEKLSIILPVWPPEDSRINEYPKLSRWKITICTVDDFQSFYTTAPVFTYSFSKNSPGSIIAEPITFLENNQETQYFKPSGVLYPFSSIADDSITMTWDQGFLAHIIQRIIRSKIETGVSDIHLTEFLEGYNWQKAQTSILKKIETTSNNPEKAFFNPWYIDSTNLLENLCYGNFKASFLNQANVSSFTLSDLLQETNIHPLSSFIPENQNLLERNIIGLQKNTVNFIGDGKLYGVTIVFKSAKKVSKELIHMPIYIEDI